MNDWLMHSKGAWKKHKYQTRTGTANHWSYTYLRDKKAEEQYRKDLQNADLTESEKVNESINETRDYVDKYTSDHKFGYYTKNEEPSDSDSKVKKFAQKIAKKAADKTIQVAKNFVKSFWDFTVIEYTKVLRHGDEDMENELYHWGILGMHWGERRFQNRDGSLTSAGRERYLKGGNGPNQFKGGKQHPSKGISRKEVKQIVKDYNYYHGTKIKPHKGTFVTKGQYTYDYKGRRVQTKRDVYTKQDQSIDTIVRFMERFNGTYKLNNMNSEQLKEYYEREFYKQKIKDLKHNKSNKKTDDFVDRIIDASTKAVIEGSAQGIKNYTIEATKGSLSAVSGLARDK